MERNKQTEIIVTEYPDDGYDYSLDDPKPTEGKVILDRNISMGQAWFKTIKKDYADWKFAWAREAGQNSLDAGATSIMVTVVLNDDGDTEVTWTDNGCGMNADILENKFMAVGGSDKPDGGTGGFGVAKLILAFAQKSYEIRSRTIKALGVCQKYRLIEDLPNFAGLRLSVVMEGDEVDSMCRKIKRWVRFTTTKCSVVLNGDELTKLRMHKAKLETSWCKVYTHVIDDVGMTEYGYESRLYSHKIRVRINRQYMFDIYTSVDAHITVDIVGTDSQDYLTSNRDGMNVNYRYKLQKLVEELYENPNTIKDTDEQIDIYEGAKGKITLEEHKPKKMRVALAAKPPKVGINDPSAEGIKPSIPRQSVATMGKKQTFKAIKELLEGYDIIVANSTSKTIPSKWIPGGMNKTAAKVINRWIRVVQVVGLILERTEEVTPGFTFSSTARASCQYHPEYGYMLLINPVEISETKFINYWKDNSTSFYEMVAVAVHELTHIDQRNHCVGFARDITYSMGKVLAKTPLLEMVRMETA